MAKPNDRKALGRGLNALLPAKAAAPKAEVPPPAAGGGFAGIQEIELDKISPNPEQPRTLFDDQNLQELAQSIREHGIIQPLVIQQVEDERYHLIAGERRWRAARIAGLEKVPVVLRHYSKERLLEVALIENLQREDLNPIEVAKALNRLATEYKLNHDDIAKRTGKDRTTVANLIRLLRLPEEVQTLVKERRLAMGHARALLALEDPEKQIDFAERAAAQGLSVREVERLVNDATSTRPDRNKGHDPEEPAPPDAKDPNIAYAERSLEAVLGTRVRLVVTSFGKGKIEIDYFSEEELNRLYSMFMEKLAN